MRYSLEWHNHRREFHQFFHQRKVPVYQPIQLEECHVFLRRALDDPTRLAPKIRLCVVWVSGEVHSYLGADRLSRFDDYDDLIYIQAVILETMRWMPVLPLSVPHNAMAENVDRGLHIPKGTIILTVSAILRYFCVRHCH